MQQIGQQIRKIRKQKKLNINQLGKQVGVSGSYIAKLETGERRFSLDLLSRIAQELDIPLAGLVGASANGNGVRKIPVFRPDRLPQVLEQSVADKAEFMLEVPSLNSDNSFAMIAERPSQNSHFYKPGDILIFRPDTRFLPGDCVLFHSNDRFQVGEYQAAHAGNGNGLPAAKLIGTVNHI